jgi:hypothetical protein
MKKYKKDKRYMPVELSSFFFLAVLGFELRASHLLVRLSIMRATPLPAVVYTFFLNQKNKNFIGSHILLTSHWLKWPFGYPSCKRTLGKENSINWAHRHPEQNWACLIKGGKEYWLGNLHYGYKSHLIFHYQFEKYNMLFALNPSKFTKDSVLILLPDIKPNQT